MLENYHECKKLNCGGAFFKRTRFGIVYICVTVDLLQWTRNERDYLYQTTYSLEVSGRFFLQLVVVITTKTYTKCDVSPKIMGFIGLQDNQKIHHSETNYLSPLI